MDFVQGLLHYARDDRASRHCEEPFDVVTSLLRPG